MTTPEDLREAVFTSIPLYRDSYGYVWQRLRNGRWHSTDGVHDNVTPAWADQPTDAERGPYTRLEAPGWESRAALQDAYNQVMTAWEAQDAVIASLLPQLAAVTAERDAAIRARNLTANAANKLAHLHQISTDQILADIRTIRARLHTVGWCDNCTPIAQSAFNDLGQLLLEPPRHLPEARTQASGLADLTGEAKPCQATTPPADPGTPQDPYDPENPHPHTCTRYGTHDWHLCTCGQEWRKDHG